MASKGSTLLCSDGLNCFNGMKKKKRFKISEEENASDPVIKKYAHYFCNENA